jgi:hypothetical protein
MWSASGPPRRPAKEASEVAAKQVKVLLGRLGKVQTVPRFVFDASSTIP